MAWLTIRLARSAYLNVDSVSSKLSDEGEMVAIITCIKLLCF